MTDWRQALVVCLIIGSALLVAGPPAHALDGESEEMWARLSEIGLRVDRCLHNIRHDAERGLGDRTLTTIEAESASVALDGIEKRLRQLPVENGQPLLEKLASIRLQLGNLQRAAIRPETVPPSPTKANARIVHKGRQPGMTDAPPANDDCSGAFSVGLGTFAGSTAEATNDGEATCGASIFSPDVWYLFFAYTTGYVVFDTVGSSYDTVLSVHSECPGTMANEIVCNDDSLGIHASVRTYVYAGSEYLIRVSGVNGDSGPYALNISTGGGISGRVADGVATNPIAGARVEYFNDAGYYMTSVSSASDGTFIISGLESGEYFVGTDLYSGSWIDELYDDHPCPGGPPYGCDPQSGDPVTVVAGSVTAGIDFVLEEAGQITGLILEEGTGEAIQGAAIRIYDSVGGSFGSDYSDAIGEYRVEGLSGGTYFAVVTTGLWADEAYDNVPCPGGPPSGCDPTQATAIVVANNTATSGIDFDLDRLGSISGSVTDRSTSNPIAGADIYLYNSFGNYVGSTYADPAGNYMIGGLPDGTYYAIGSNYYDYVRQLYDGIDCPQSGCDVMSGTPIVISDQVTAAGVDFDLLRLGSITGTVHDKTTSQPLPSIRVRAYNDAGSSIDYSYTDSSGTFMLTGLPAGTYFVVTDNSAFADILFDDIDCHPGCDPTDGTPVSVSNGATTGGIDFGIAPLGQITGSVSEVGGGSSFTARVRLYGEDGVYLAYDYTSGGDYSFSGLDTGNYFLVAANYYDLTYLEELYDDLPCWDWPSYGCDVTSGTPVPVVVSTVTSDIDFALKKRGSISGSVVDAVSLQPVSGRVYVEELAGDNVVSATIYTGDYLVGGLIPGDYRVVVDTVNHIDQVWNSVPCAGEYPGGCATAVGASITVGVADEIEDIDFSVGQLGFIGGVVRDAMSLQPLSSWFVRIFDSVGNALNYDYTSADGSYEFPGLWPGTYLVATDERASTHTDQLFQGLPCPGGPSSGCDPTTGTPLKLVIGSVANSVDFALDRTASISGIVTDEDTGLPLSYCRVRVWDEQGDLIRSDDTDSFGVYLLQGLSSGTYFVGTAEFGTYSPDYIDELYDDIPCIGGPPNGCDATKGFPIVVAASQTVRFVDFALTPRMSGIIGMVSNALNGEPLGGVRVDVWDGGTGAFRASTNTNAAGTYRLELDAGTYVAATDNAGDWVNRIFDDLECLVGSAYNGDCDPMVGDPIVVVYGEMTDPVDFALQPGERLFGDGFESGDTDAWSSAVP